jgi:hypothetical protein
MFLNKRVQHELIAHSQICWKVRLSCHTSRFKLVDRVFFRKFLQKSLQCCRIIIHIYCLSNTIVYILVLFAQLIAIAIDDRRTDRPAIYLPAIAISWQYFLLLSHWLDCKNAQFSLLISNSFLLVFKTSHFDNFVRL